MFNSALRVLALGAVLSLSAHPVNAIANSKPQGDGDVSHRTESKFRFAAAFACLQLSHPDRCRVESVIRADLGDGIGHYQVMVRVGPHPFDVIGVHRVVREKHPGSPRRTRRAVLLGHGAFSFFAGSFLQESVGDVPRPGGSFATVLAAGGVDVWGIDLRYVGVPADTEDASFMSEWDLGVSLADTRIALRTARLFRWFTGNGYGRIHLGGWSQGGSIAYAVADAEAKLPRWRRDVRGLVQIDSVYKVPQILEPVSCFLQDFDQGTLDAGIFASDLAPTKVPASLALSAPEEPSPFDPTLTNRQFALIQDTVPPIPPLTFHANAGIFDGNGLPTDYAHAPDVHVFQMRTLPTPSFHPVRLSRDINLIGCNRDDSPFDDSLTQIQVPIFHLGAAGGVNFGGFETPGLLGSTDKLIDQVQLLPDEQAAFDYGHADVVDADNANALVWQRVLDWIRDH